MREYKQYKDLIKYDYATMKISSLMDLTEKQCYLIKHIFKGMMLLKEFPLWSTIEIETINKCNGECSFCPVNHRDDSRPLVRMKEELFHKIIDELASLEFIGEVNLYANNEPLMDNRIVEFAKYTKEKLPGALIVLFTNGTLLTPLLSKQLLTYVGRLTINNYNDAKQLNKQMEITYPLIKDDPKVVLNMRQENEVMSSRGGQARNKKLTGVACAPCSLMFRQMVIRPDGIASQCCNDAWGITTMGDVNKNTLVEIWNNDTYRELRESMIQMDRHNIKTCKLCDTFG